MEVLGRNDLRCRQRMGGRGLSRFEIKIDGQPVAATRPRFRRTSKGVMTHPTKKTHESSMRIKKLAEKAMKGKEKLSGPLEVKIHAMFECPKYKHRVNNPAKTTLKANGPDVDNIAKHYMDALLASGIVAKDDNLVVSLLCTKLELAQGIKPYTLITIDEILSDDNPWRTMIDSILEAI